MLRRITTLGLAAALSTAVLLPATEANAIVVCPGYLDPYALNIPGYADCMVDWSIDRVNDVTLCTQNYDPLAPPLGGQVEPETTAYVTCLTT